LEALLPKVACPAKSPLLASLALTLTIAGTRVVSITRETGTELFVSSDPERPGTFRTTYRFEAKYEDVNDPATEIFGRCQHPIVEGSGTDIYEGVSGELFFKDNVETGEFLYRGHLRY
jgi:hypothetical protein